MPLSRRAFIITAAGAGAAGAASLAPWAWRLISGKPDPATDAESTGAASPVLNLKNGVLLAGAEGRACLIDLVSGQVAAIPLSFTAHSFVRHPALSTRFFGISRAGGEAAEIDIRENTLVRTLQAPGNRLFTGHGFFSPDGKLFYMAMLDLTGEGGKLAVYSYEDLKLQTQYPLASGGVHECKLLSDGTVLVTSSGLHVARNVEPQMGRRVSSQAMVYFDLHGGKVKGTGVLAAGDYYPGHFDVLPDGTLVILAVMIRDRTVHGRIYTGHVQRPGFTRVNIAPEFLQHLEGGVLSLAVDEQGRVAAITNPVRGVLLFVSLATGKAEVVQGERGGSIVFDPGTKNFVTISGGEIHFHSVEEGKPGLVKRVAVAEPDLLAGFQGLSVSR